MCTGVAMGKEFIAPFYLYQLMIYSTWIWSSWLMVGGATNAYLLRHLILQMIVFTKPGSGQTHIGKALKKEGDHFRRRPCWSCCRERLFEYLDGQAEPGKKTKRYFLSVFI